MARILILGGGYGGLRTAYRLHSLLRRGERHEVTLVDQNEFHQIVVRLHELAAGSLDCSDVLIPFERLLRGKNVNFLRARVVGIDLAEHKVETTEGTLGYDKLVLALGSETNFFGIPGMKENAFELKSYHDAVRLRNHVEQLFVKARAEADETRRRDILGIMVGGGGFTGTEIAGELADYRDDLAEKYGIDPAEMCIGVIDPKEMLLGGFDRILAERAAHILESKGVKLLLGSGLKSFESGTVALSTGQSIRTNTLIWTGGVRATSLISQIGLETGAAGRAVTNPYAESVDHTGVYLVGDCALVLDPQSGRPIAPSAQLALQQGPLVAYNIAAELRDRPRLRFRPKIVAEIVSLGRYNAVALLGPLRLSGLAPSLLKKAVAYRYIYSLGGPGLVIEKLGLGRQTFDRIADAFRHSSFSNRKGTR